MQKYSHFKLRPVEAKILQCNSMNINHSTYAVIDVGDRQFKSQIDSQSGLNPHWSDEFDLDGYCNSIATIRVYDSNLMHIADNLLGEAIFSLSCMKFGAERMSHRIDLMKNTNKVGELTLEFEPVSNTFENQPTGGTFSSTQVTSKTLDQNLDELPLESPHTAENVIPKYNLYEKGAEEAEGKEDEVKEGEGKGSLENPSLEQKKSLMDTVKSEVISFEKEMVHELGVVGGQMKHGVSQLGEQIGKKLGSIFHFGESHAPVNEPVSNQEGETTQSTQSSAQIKPAEGGPSDLCYGKLDKGIEKKPEVHEQTVEQKGEDSHTEGHKASFLDKAKSTLSELGDMINRNLIGDANDASSPLKLSSPIKLSSPVKLSSPQKRDERVVEDSSEIFAGIDFRPIERNVSQDMGMEGKHAVMEGCHTNEERIEPTPPQVQTKHHPHILDKGDASDFALTDKDAETFGIKNKGEAPAGLNLLSFDDSNSLLSKEGILPADYSSNLSANYSQ